MDLLVKMFSLRCCVRIAFIFVLANTMYMSADEWVKRADMPIAKADHATCVINGNIIVFGGSDRFAPLKSVEEYDPLLDKWTKKQNMPDARTAHQICMINKKIYMISDIFNPNSVIEYDISEDKWDKKENMPTIRMWPSACVWNGNIYVFGGTTGNGAVKSNVEVYDPSKDEWTKKMICPSVEKVFPQV